MSSKGAAYIVLPRYVVYIGLLYALLLTSGLVLAWVALYRHERTIQDLKLVLQDFQNNGDDISYSFGKKGDRGILNEDVNNVAFTEQAKDQRSRRNLEEIEGLNHTRKKKRRRKGKKKIRIYVQGKKGDKGDKGDIGIRGPDGRRGNEGPPGIMGPPGYQGSPGYRGDRGERGEAGEKGQTGEKGRTGGKGQTGGKGEIGNNGERGEKGDTGKSGEKGQNGEQGIKGKPGVKGDRGLEGKPTMLSHSAHVVGQMPKGTQRILSTPKLGKVYVMKYWKRDHVSENMTFGDGYLTVGVEGYYLIYCQMFYCDGISEYTGYEVYIDKRRILRTMYSVINKTKVFHTQFTSGIFKVKKGQKIYVGTRLPRHFYFDDTSTFFGALMLHY